jgi:Glycosyl hydrolase catalytic core
VLRRIAVALGLICLLAALLPGAASAAAKPPPVPPRGFFGVAPQDWLTDRDAEYMKAGGIETIRWPLEWAGAQPTQNGPYLWGQLDRTLMVASRHGLRVLPFIVGTPSWLAPSSQTLPLTSPEARQEWARFLQAAASRYGPGGEFWTEHAPGGSSHEPPITNPTPINSWQVWNEANFFYFASPATPKAYARLLRLSSPAIKAGDPSAKVIMSGLFGLPGANGGGNLPAAEFLRRLYRVPGIQNYFDAVALHPYAGSVQELEEMVTEFHDVTVENEDRVPLYITEMGWGSQYDPNVVSFERGYQGQARSLRKAYGYLLANRQALDLKSVYWFSWKDIPGSCNYCDSVGLFGGGEGFHPKPAWYALVSLTHGRLRP